MFIRTHDLLRNPQTAYGSTVQKYPQKRHFSGRHDKESRAAANSLPAATEGPANYRAPKHLQNGHFYKAADGIRTHDLLHGTQTL